MHIKPGKWRRPTKWTNLSSSGSCWFFQWTRRYRVNLAPPIVTDDLKKGFCHSVCVFPKAKQVYNIMKFKSYLHQKYLPHDHYQIKNGKTKRNWKHAWNGRCRIEDVPVATAKLEELAGGGEDDDRHLNITQNR